MLTWAFYFAFFISLSIIFSSFFSPIPTAFQSLDMSDSLERLDDRQMRESEKSKIAFKALESETKTQLQNLDLKTKVDSIAVPSGTVVPSFVSRYWNINLAAYRFMVNSRINIRTDNRNARATPPHLHLLPRRRRRGTRAGQQPGAAAFR